MFPTVARLSKASRRPLTTKRGNKDYYKGTRQAFLPGGHRTGAPGKHVVRGKAKYRLLDEKVRVFVAPPLHVIESSPLKPYVHTSVQQTKSERLAPYGKLRTAGGLTPEHYFNFLRTTALEQQRVTNGQLVERAQSSDGQQSPTLLNRAMETLGLR
ncbi:hypothetical protein DFJ43DRAFT_1094256 [Lentinula guzmanii]|uniref:Uncharacterized protein n=2 Tax=Lentinula TaxID=5352 RepID=A0AA38JCD9_9AGAR|nr:hypothetical protein DFJ43DRAFT_1094256 [Lentinula guzmanii]KAJ3781877.1 hypothetical protein GGU10DRAFT_365343 [Lentinula aff. detonsa]